MIARAIAIASIATLLGAMWFAAGFFLAAIIFRPSLGARTLRVEQDIASSSQPTPLRSGSKSLSELQQEWREVHRMWND